MKVEKLNILYVDDEEQNLVSFKAVFRRYHNIFTARSGPEGLEILREHKIHLIITDQRMPDMSGVQFLEVATKTYPDAIRMVLTGFSDMEAIISAINTGRVFRYINKPWNEDELKMTIESARQLLSLQERNKQLLTELQHKVLEQEKTLRLFQKYVPEAVVEKVLNTSEESLFEGELRDVTVLFCDIRGFTAISEQIGPREAVSLLNAYYSLMTESIKKYNGSVNQFVGDEIFACFGAPVANLNNESSAVICAIEMRDSLHKLNKEFNQKIGGDVQIGIGVHCGVVVAGNTGSEERIEYSITGDTVNTGSRIEQLTQDYPNTILISDVVYEQVKNLVEVKAWEPVSLKGKKDKLQVYEVLRLKNRV
jgi:adenylate cyclase